MENHNAREQRKLSVPVPPAGLLVGTTPGGNAVEIRDGVGVNPTEKTAGETDVTPTDADVAPSGKLVNITTGSVGMAVAVTPLGNEELAA